MADVTVRDLRNKSAALLARVARGETFTVTRDGDPVASVVPLPRRAVGVEELIARRRHLPPVNAAGLRADLDDVLDPTL